MIFVFRYSTYQNKCGSYQEKRSFTVFTEIRIRCNYIDYIVPGTLVDDEIIRERTIVRTEIASIKERFIAREVTLSQRARCTLFSAHIAATVGRHV